MKKFNISAVIALFVLSLAIGACAPRPGGYYDGHGNHGDSFVP
ncbi:MAG TPA: hypothetical protein VH835_14400 [Dongiaceae bacterium]|jgi:hypothetical protein